MESTLEFNTKKNIYLAPTVEIYFLTYGKDILCMSTEEGNDNDFGAGGLLGEF